jgi:hypothetical protein
MQSSTFSSTGERGALERCAELNARLGSDRLQHGEGSGDYSDVHDANLLEGCAGIRRPSGMENQ